MGFFQNVNAYHIGECRTSSDKKHLYMYEKTGWREVAGTRRKRQWIDKINNRVYMKSRKGFWNAYEDKMYFNFSNWHTPISLTLTETFNTFV